MGTRRAYGTGSLYVKDGHWYGRWRVGGGRRTARKIGPATGAQALTKKRAEARLREIILSEPPEQTQTAERVTVSELGSALLAQLEFRGRKPSHIESARYHLSAHICPLLGDEPAETVTKHDVQRLISRLYRLGRSPKTIQNVIGTLHSVLEIAVARSVIERNPCRMATLPRATREPALRFLTPAEVERVLRAAPPADAPQMEREWWPTLRLLTLAATMTGLRLGELSALRWQDLDYAAMKVRVQRAFVRGRYVAPKSAHSVRAVPLASRLMDELDAWHRQTPWNQDVDLIFAGPLTGRPINRRPLLVFFKRALERADVRPVRIHDLRHTFATTVASSGQVSLRTLQEWMGHLDTRTTQIYAAYMPGEREHEQLDAAFRWPIGGQSGNNTPSVARESPQNTA